LLKQLVYTVAIRFKRLSIRAWRRMGGCK